MEKFREQLFAAPPGSDPDRVDEQVVRNELAAFQTLSAQTR